MMAMVANSPSGETVLTAYAILGITVCAIVAVFCLAEAIWSLMVYRDSKPHRSLMMFFMYVLGLLLAVAGIAAAVWIKTKLSIPTDFV